MKTAFTIEEPVVLPIVDSEAVFPVRRIYCVGKNYAAHAAEMGGAVSKDAPFFFTKHPQDVVLSGTAIDYPLGTESLHYELELVVVIDKALTNASEKEARDAIFGYAVGIDLTKRDLQMQLKANAYPWALSKSFTNSAVISSVVTDVDATERDSQRLVLKKNGEVYQDASLAEMVRSVESLLVYLSTLDTLQPGDILFTGTPAGVGEVTRGDTLQGEITRIGEVSITIN